MEDEFEQQLHEEELAKLKEEEKQTYTDKDGTVFEWDVEKKAWFPKIDDDFIANYQMNYGNTEYDGSFQPKQSDTEAYEKYCKDYYNYYGYNYEPEAASSTTENAESKSDNTKSYINPETGQEFKDYAEYYAYYYGEEYAEYYKNFQQEDISIPGSNQAQKKVSKKELKKVQADEKRKIAPEKEEPAWFKCEDDQGTHVYVSGLSSDTTDEEFQELMSKYGLIMFDPFTKKPKLKLYKDKEGNIKGDGLCCYIKKESVDLALKLLDDYNFKGCKLSVEKAQFVMKGDFDPAKKKKKLSNKQKRKMKENQAKLFDWKLEKTAEVRLKHEKMVILKHMFDVKEFEDDPTLINELREDVRVECVKFGDVRKVTLYDRNPEGVMSVIYKTPEEADKCIEALNGRWFAGKQIIAESWDGKIKYEIEETEEEKALRLKTWDQFLGADNEKTNNSGASSSGVNPTINSDGVSTSAVETDGANSSKGEMGGSSTFTVKCDADGTSKAKTDGDNTFKMESDGDSTFVVNSTVLSDSVVSFTNSVESYDGNISVDSTMEPIVSESSNSVTSNLSPSEVTSNNTTETQQDTNLI